MRSRRVPEVGGGVVHFIFGAGRKGENSGYWSSGVVIGTVQLLSLVSHRRMASPLTAPGAA